VGGNTRDGSTPFSRIESTWKPQLFKAKTQDPPEPPAVHCGPFPQQLRYLGETTRVHTRQRSASAGDPCGATPLVLHVEFHEHGDKTRITLSDGPNPAESRGTPRVAGTPPSTIL
jgi:hypothetical protein